MRLRVRWPSGEVQEGHLFDLPLVPGDGIRVEHIEKLVG